MQPNLVSIAVNALNFPLVIGAVVLFFRLKKDDADPRLRRALFTTIAMMGFEVLALALGEKALGVERLAVVAVIDVLLFFKLWVMTYVGQVLWNRQGVDYWGLECLRARPQTVILGSVAAVALLVLYSIALFLCTRPSYGPIAQALGTHPPDDLRSILLLALFVANFAVAEELVFRGCVQPMLAHWLGNSPASRWTAFALTCGLWTAMHLGVLSPDWVKLVQVLPLGIFLGLWFRYAGFIGAAGTHLLFNLVLAPLSYQLLGH